MHVHSTCYKWWHQIVCQKQIGCEVFRVCGWLPLKCVASEKRKEWPGSGVLVTCPNIWTVKVDMSLRLWWRRCYFLLQVGATIEHELTFSEATRGKEIIKLAFGDWDEFDRERSWFRMHCQVSYLLSLVCRLKSFLKTKEVIITGQNVC